MVIKPKSIFQQRCADTTKQTFNKREKTLIFKPKTKFNENYCKYFNKIYKRKVFVVIHFI